MSKLDKLTGLLEQLIVEIRGNNSSSRTPDLQSENEGATPSPSTKKLKKRKIGRPKGSKNKKTVHFVTGMSTKPVQVKEVNIPEQEVDLYVSPTISINGIDYAGGCRVKETIANTLKYMMEQHRKGLARVTEDVSHITKDLGEIK